MRVWPSALWQSFAVLLLAIMIGLTVNLFRSKGLPLLGDWSAKSQTLSSAGGEAHLVFLDDAMAMFAGNEAIFLDARPHEAYRSGHIQGALSLPWEEFDKRFDEVMGSIPREFPVITYCDGESCGLSGELAVALLAKGYVDVRVLPDGWRIWQQQNLPVESF